VATIQLVLTNPVVAFRTMRRVGGLPRPSYFALSVASIAVVVACLEQIFLPPLTRRAPNIQVPLVTVITTVIMCVILAPVLIFITIHARAGLTHLVLMMLSAARYPYETTFRTTSYCVGSVGPIIMIPYFGVYILAIASIAYSIIALAEAQEISGGKAAAAVLLPLVIGGCCAGPLLASALFFSGFR
jgi:hypothetical protein